MGGALSTAQKVIGTVGAAAGAVNGVATLATTVMGLVAAGDDVVFHPLTGRRLSGAAVTDLNAQWLDHRFEIEVTSKFLDSIGRCMDDLDDQKALNPTISAKQVEILHSLVESCCNCMVRAKLQLIKDKNDNYQIPDADDAFWTYVQYGVSFRSAMVSLFSAIIKQNVRLNFSEPSKVAATVQPTKLDLSVIVNQFTSTTAGYDPTQWLPQSGDPFDSINPLIPSKTTMDTLYSNAWTTVAGTVPVVRREHDQTHRKSDEHAVAADPIPFGTEGLLVFKRIESDNNCSFDWAVGIQKNQTKVSMPVPEEVQGGSTGFILNLVVTPSVVSGEPVLHVTGSFLTIDATFAVDVGITLTDAGPPTVPNTVAKVMSSGGVPRLLVIEWKRSLLLDFPTPSSLLPSAELKSRDPTKHEHKIVN